MLRFFMPHRLKTKKIPKSTKIPSGATQPHQNTRHISDISPPQGQSHPTIQQIATSHFDLSDSQFLSHLRSLTPAAFEHYIAKMFRRMEYDTSVTPFHRDGGIDILLIKHGIHSYVQCKKYITQQVSVSEIRDFYGATIDSLNFDNGYCFFITTNIFSDDAKRFARQCRYTDHFKLIDGQRLIDIIRLLEKNHRPIQEFTQSAKHNATYIPCPRCKFGTLVKRQGRAGHYFTGCSNYPNCHYTRSTDFI